MTELNIEIHGEPESKAWRAQDLTAKSTDDRFKEIAEGGESLSPGKFWKIKPEPLHFGAYFKQIFV